MSTLTTMMLADAAEVTKAGSFIAGEGGKRVAIAGTPKAVMASRAAVNATQQCVGCKTKGSLIAANSKAATLHHKAAAIHSRAGNDRLAAAHTFNARKHAGNINNMQA